MVEQIRFWRDLGPSVAAAGTAARCAVVSAVQAYEERLRTQGLFAPWNLSESLAAICGGKKMPRTEVTKKLWVYIKAKKLNNGRIITPDEKLKKIFPAKVGLLKPSALACEGSSSPE